MRPLISCLIFLLSTTGLAQTQTTSDLKKVIAVQQAQIITQKNDIEKLKDIVEKLSNQIADLSQTIKDREASIINRVNGRFNSLKVSKTSSGLKDHYLRRAEKNGGFTHSHVRCSEYTDGVVENIRIWVNPDGWPSTPPVVDRVSCSRIQLNRGSDIQ